MIDRAESWDVGSVAKPRGKEEERKEGRKKSGSKLW